MKKIIAIYCGISTKEEVETIQEHFFNYNCDWYSSIAGDNRKLKSIKDYLIIENDYMFQGDVSTVKSIDTNNIFIFNSPVEFLRHYKIKKLKTNLN